MLLPFKYAMMRETPAPLATGAMNCTCSNTTHLSVSTMRDMTDQACQHQSSNYSNFNRT